MTKIVLRQTPLMIEIIDSLRSVQPQKTVSTHVQSYITNSYNPQCTQIYLCHQHRPNLSQVSLYRCSRPGPGRRRSVDPTYIYPRLTVNLCAHPRKFFPTSGRRKSTGLGALQNNLLLQSMCILRTPHSATRAAALLGSIIMNTPANQRLLNCRSDSRRSKPS
jgi:hypothetical protein